MSPNLQMVCPNCRAVNRVEQARMGQGPVCGKCKQSLTDPKPVALDPAGFQRYLAKSDLPLLVDFWAPWCGPCRSMAPAFEQASAMLSPGVRLAKLNTQDHQDMGAMLGIQSIPTMVLFKGGREAARISGALPADQIVGWVRQNL